MQLNISKMLVILNYVDYMKELTQRISNGEKDVNIKHHIGAGYHISCNSPYKNFSHSEGNFIEIPSMVRINDGI